MQTATLISSFLVIALQGRRESLPVVHQVVRRRFSGPLLLPPLRRRHSCQDHNSDPRLFSAAYGLPLHRLEALYCRALTTHDEHRSVNFCHLHLTVCLANDCPHAQSLWTPVGQSLHIKHLKIELQQTIILRIDSSVD